MAHARHLALLLPLLAAAPRQDAYLGVMFDASDRPTVAEVVPGSPAERAGIQPGDVLLAIDGTTMPTVAAFSEAIRKLSSGDRIKLTVRRSGQLLEVPVTLGKRFDDGEKPKTAKPATPKAPTIEQAEGKAKTKGQDPMPAAPGGGRPFLGISVEEDGAELVIRAVLKGSPAERAGCQVGDRIEALGGTKVRTLEQLDAALSRLGAHAKTRIALARGVSHVELPLQVGMAGAEAAAPNPDAGQPAVPKVEAPKPVAPQTANPKPEARKAEGENGAPSPSAAAPVTHPHLVPLRAEAAKKGAHLLVVCGAAWSASAQAQKRSLEDPTLAGVLAGFVQEWVDVDADGQLADLLQTRELPTLVVLDAEGRVLGRKDGYLPPDMLQTWLRKFPRASAAPAVAAALPKAAVPAHEAAMPARELETLRAEVARLRAELDALRAELSKLKK